jgi:uncharacterized protein
VKTPPSRTCLGCRRTRPKADLVRLTRTPSGTVVVDCGPRATGRGAYVCPEPECLERGLSRGRLGHAFRKPSEAGPDLVATVRAAAGREPRATLAEASPEGTLLCEAGAGAIGDVAVITVRA